MMKSTLCVLGVCLGLIATMAHAETRVWTDRKGNAIEAKFIKLSGKKVVLETPQGRRMMVPASGLSAEDQDYLARTAPPKMKIEIDLDTEREKIGEDSFSTRKREDILLKVAIEKESQCKCTQKFNAHIYIIAEAARGSTKKLVGKDKHSFSFAKSDQVGFSSKTSVEKEDNYFRDSGWEYGGYLLCIENGSGVLIDARFSKDGYKGRLEAIRKLRKGDTFSL